jgi:hypothetical protein
MSHSPRLKKISTMAGTAAAMIHVKMWKSSISGYLVKEEQRCQTKKSFYFALRLTITPMALTQPSTEPQVMPGTSPTPASALVCAMHARLITC